MSQKFNIPITRRAFMKMAAAAAGSLAAAPLLPTAAAGPMSGNTGDTISYAGKDIPVLFRADCCVVGGGPSGTAAAVSAAQSGLATVLIERGIALGGLGTLGCVLPFMDPLAPGCDTPYTKKLKERMRRHGIEMEDGVTRQGWINPEVLSLVLDEFCDEAGVSILYHTVFVDALTEGPRIDAIVVQTIAGLAAITAGTFIDASGDAILARTAGVPAERGYEKTGKNQPLSFRFEIGGIDIDRVYQYVSGELGEDWCKTAPPYYEIAEAMGRKQRYKLEAFMQRGVDSGELTAEEAVYMQGFTIIGKSGTMSMNCPELPLEFSATDPVSYSRGVSYGRKMMRHIFQYLHRHLPGFENAYISREATMLGARESWRIRGQYYLEEKDYHEQSRFPDAVARTAWFIDAHGEKISEKLPKGGFYEIPYRSLVTDEIENLLVTGRSISASFILQASMRIQPTCMSIGEAAGIAAAWAKNEGIPVNAVAWNEIPEKTRSYVSRG
ncbi:MAG: FAD-dependent oxidoreductase [Schwartzia sp.]|nr:FAD-dependent oxidoreductase [Schwartzia sp. (in: firmicutes)]